jgi:carbon monoxide dehydrogenase subunit G
MTQVWPGRLHPAASGYDPRMARFTATTSRQAVVPAERVEVWQVLTDPHLLPRLTPYLDRILVDGNRWRWEMSRLPVLSVSVAPSFTERMDFDPQERIDFSHEPPPGTKEKAAAEGTYTLEEVSPRETELSIDLTLTVDLPLPGVAAPAVGRVMQGVLDRMGEKFAENLLDHLR